MKKYFIKVTFHSFLWENFHQSRRDNHRVMCVEQFTGLFGILRENELGAHDTTWRGSLCSDNDPRCHWRKLKIISSELDRSIEYRSVDITIFVSFLFVSFFFFFFFFFFAFQCFGYYISVEHDEKHSQPKWWESVHGGPRHGHINTDLAPWKLCKLAWFCFQWG